MRKTLLSLLILGPSLVLAGPQYPVQTRAVESFPKASVSAVNSIWTEIHKPYAARGDKHVEQSPAECRVFEAYTLGLLRKLIQNSQLETQTRDLYLYMDCFNMSRFPLDARLRGRTVEITQGYFGSLQSEDELVAVLAHELSHHVLRHEEIIEPLKPKKRTQILGDIFSSGGPAPGEAKVRAQILQNENEAEVASVAILANAGYSYQGAIQFLNRVEALRLRSAGLHSDFPTRREMITKRAAELGLAEIPLRPFPAEINAAIQGYFVNQTQAEREPGEGRIKVMP